MLYNTNTGHIGYRDARHTRFHLARETIRVVVKRKKITNAKKDATEIKPFPTRRIIDIVILIFDTKILFIN